MLVAKWLIGLMDNYRSSGSGLCSKYRCNGMHNKPSNLLIRQKPEPLAVPQTINQVWSMDFMSDKLQDGSNLRLFNVIDDFNREALGCFAPQQQMAMAA